MSNIAIFSHGWRSRRSHEQDGETLGGAAMPRRPASGDPAMALETSMHTNEPHGPLLFPAEPLPDNRRMFECIRPQIRGPRPRVYSAPDTEFLDDRPVTALVDAFDVIEQLPALRHKLEEPTPGMVILDVGLEMLGQIVDPFREDGDLHFGRAGVAGFGRIRLDDFRLAVGRNRHRQ